MHDNDMMKTPSGKVLSLSNHARPLLLEIFGENLPLAKTETSNRHSLVAPPQPLTPCQKSATITKGRKSTN